MYDSVDLDPAFPVTKLVSLHYNEFATGFHFEGERHPFWEIVYMDKGTAEIGADDRRIELREGRIVFHQPGEFHTIWAKGPSAPNILVAAFCCESPEMDLFKGLAVELTNEEKRSLGRAVREAADAFVPSGKDTYLPLVLRDGASPWALHQIRLELESLLLSLARRIRPSRGGTGSSKRPTAPLARLEYDAGMVRRVEEYMSSHMADNLRFSDICVHFRVTGTTLKRLFRSIAGTGAMARLSQIRIAEAKALIREGRMNFTEIALQTGFSAIHYFSRRFRELTGMSPSEYAKSVKVEYED